MSERVRVGVLVSGRGSNMLALSEHKRRDPDRSYDIVLVASNVPDARGLVLAKRLGIKTWSLSHKGMTREEFDRKVTAALEEHGVEIIALAGYMRLLSCEFVANWEGRILNIHPALLPKFPGLHAQRRALEAGEAESGCTVHFVDEGTDSGPIVLQERVPIEPGDTEEALAVRILEKEHRAYPEAIARVLSELPSRA